MTSRAYQHVLSGIFALVLLSPVAWAETSDYLEEDPYADKDSAATEKSQNQEVAPTGEMRGSKPARPARKSSRTKPDGRKYFTDQTPRSDAGVFHVGFAFGGNFYIEPEWDNTVTPPSLSGNFFKDFGFQAGVYFDHDYSELDENIPLMLRGMIGYKYILGSVHVFSFDGMVRHMWRWSEKASFGVGLGASAAVWYRSVTPTSPNEEIVFLPTMLLSAGFEFNPFMVDFKWAINRFGADNVITGFELYFGFRL